MKKLTPYKHAVMMGVLGFVMGLPTGYYGLAVVPYSQVAVREQTVVAFDERYHEVIEVLDGDTVRIESGDLIRLIGIDTPEKNKCYFEEATAALTGLVANREVYFDKDEASRDEFGRLLRYMFVRSENKEEGDLNVNREMLRLGYALASPVAPNRRYQPNFKRAENEALENNIGIWSACESEVIEAVRQLDTEAPSEECTIKGNIAESSKARNYFLPGCANYDRVKIDPNRGERWLCSEEEAVEDGWDKAYGCK